MENRVRGLAMARSGFITRSDTQLRTPPNAMLAFTSAKRLLYKCPKNRMIRRERDRKSYIGKKGVPSRRAWPTVESGRIFIGLPVRVWFSPVSCIEFV